jgi:hypothetical protein
MLAQLLFLFLRHILTMAFYELASGGFLVKRRRWGEYFLLR